jgi:DNA (cytosine-5)-methyltransferase 1
MQMQTFITEPMLCLNDQGGNRMDITENITSTLRSSMGGNLPIVMEVQKENGDHCNEHIHMGISADININNQHVLFDNHAKDCRYNGPLNVAPTVAAIYGTGGNNVPLVSKAVAYSLDSKDSNSMKSSNPKSGCRETDKARTIDTSNPDPSKNQGGIAIVQESYCIASNIINRQEKNGGNGCGFQENISYTLTTSDIHAVCSIPRTYQDIVGALCVGDEKGIGNQYVSQDKCIIDYKMMESGDGEDINNNEGNVLDCRDDGSKSENSVATKKLVRRLTPLECERLQGFPDGWTEIPKATDSPRYKALGNSVAVPCVDFIMHGIAYFLRKVNEEMEEN